MKAIREFYENEKKSMKESEKKSIKKIHEKLIKFPIALWNHLEDRAKEENIDNMSEFIRAICREYLSTSGFKNRIGTDEELIELERRQDQLRNEEYQFIANLNSLLKSAKNEEKPINYEEKISQVLITIENQKLDFDGIFKATKIPKEELIVITGNLVDSGDILFDERWRFYKA